MEYFEIYAAGDAPDELKALATHVATGEYGVAESLCKLLGFSLNEE